MRQLDKIRHLNRPYAVLEAPLKQEKSFKLIHLKFERGIKRYLSKEKRQQLTCNVFKQVK